MKEAEIVEMLASIPIGTIISWIAVVAGIIGAFCAGAIWLYKAFEKYKKLLDDNKYYRDTVVEHDTALKQIIEELKKINNKLDSQDVTTMKKLRRELVKDGEWYLAQRKMTIREWRSWMEMFEEYTVKFKQNSYVQTLKDKIERDCTIVGALDEHGNDI